MGRNKRTYNEDFKEMVIKEALKEEETLQELSLKHGVPVTTIATWKTTFLNSNQSKVNEAKNNKKRILELEKELEKAYIIIGKQKLEAELLEKKLNL